MLKLKKFVASVMALGLVVSMVQVSTFANEEAIKGPHYTWGQITEINEDQIRVQNDSEGENDVILNLNEDTIIIDAVTGDPVAREKLKVNESISAYVSQASTRSMPPIRNAYILIVNIPADFGAPQYYRIGEVVDGKEDSVRFLDENNTLVATFDSETNLFPYKTKNLLSLNDLKVGSELIVWYDIVLLSMPGQTHIDRAMLLPARLNGWVSNEESWSYYVDGSKQTNCWIASSKNRWYYVGEDGTMVKNKVVDGYTIDENGIYTK